jgi:hypothetical protein
VWPALYDAALLARAEILLDWLSHARPSPKKLRPHHVLALLAALLTAPSLAGGLVLDDHVLELGARAGAPAVPGLHVSPLSLFRFTTGRAEDNRALMDQGVLLPWWTDPHHLNAFFRPLSSLSHVLDFRLAPGAPWLMHLHSMLWLVALVLGVAHIYARIDPLPAGSPKHAMTRAAALAVLLFAIDDAHGMTVAWLANRNALIAATLALPALGAHHRYLTQRFAAGRVLGPLCFLLGLLAGETAVAVLGYIVAHAIVLDRAPIWRRAVHLLPYLAVLVAWRLVFAQLGLGSHGSGAYHDPLGEPAGYALALAQHLPVLLGSQLGAPVADLWFWGEPTLQVALLVIAGLSALLVLGLAHVLLRHDEVARFWMIGMVLSSCAVAASVPGERLLLVPSIGGAALLAKLMIALYDRLRSGDGPLPRGVAAVALLGLAIIHGPASLVGLPLRANAMKVLGDAVQRGGQRLDLSQNMLSESTPEAVVVLAAPFDVLVSYQQLRLIAAGVKHPEQLNWLATASSDVKVTRLDERTLRIEPERGFLYSAPEQHYRGDTRSLPAGTRVELTLFTATVRSNMTDGRPKVVDFHFKRSLDDWRQLRVVQFNNGSLETTSPPRVGETRVIPKADFFLTMVREALGLYKPLPMIEASRSGSP